GLCGGKRAAPFAIAGVYHEIGRPRSVEHLGGPEPGTAKRRVLCADEALEPTVDDVVAELAANVLFSEGLGIGVIERGSGARDGDLFRQSGVDVDGGFTRMAERDRARV